MPALGSSASPSSKQGAISLIGSLTQRLGTRIVPYLLLLVVPLMGCMADSMLDVRQPASATFAAVVALLPLAQASALCLALTSSNHAVYASLLLLHFLLLIA